MFFDRKPEMQLLFKQRMFSWLDSYDVYDEEGHVVFRVKGALSWGHRMEIYDVDDVHLGTVKEELFKLLPSFAIYIGNERVGRIQKKISFFKPKFELDCKDWTVEGDLWEWNYEVEDRKGRTVMKAHKELMRWTDTYVMDVMKAQDALYCLMIVLAIDAAKCSEEKHDD